MKNIISLVAYISAITTAFLCSIALYVTDYASLFFLPIAYFFAYQILKRLYRDNPRYRITISVILILLWVRMVFIPYYGTITGKYYISQSDSAELIQTAILLSIYECFIICGTIFIICKISLQKSLMSNQPILRGNRGIYKILIIIAALVFVFIGRHYNLLEFGIKSVEAGAEREGDIVDTRIILIRQIVSCGYLFLFFCLIEKYRKKYNLFHNKKYITYAIILAALMTCIIIGERRTAQVYIAFASCWLLIRTYPDSKQRIVTIIGSTAFTILTLMTVYKHFNAFLYNSYAEALQNAAFKDGMSAGMIDAYFYGVDTIKTNLKYAQYANLSILNVLYDIARSIFGVHFIFKSEMLMTSQAYNSYLYQGAQLTGYLLSSSGYGYIHLGFLFAPIFTSMNICIMSFLETRMRICKSIEMCYILAYIYMRFAFGCLGSLPPLIGASTMFLFIKGLIFMTAKLFTKHNYVT